jgi:hypothetical protein
MSGNSSLSAVVTNLQSSVSLTSSLLYLPSRVLHLSSQSIPNAATSLVPLNTSALMSSATVKTLSISLWLLIPSPAVYGSQLLCLM